MLAPWAVTSDLSSMLMPWSYCPRAWPKRLYCELNWHTVPCDRVPAFRTSGGRVLHMHDGHFGRWLSGFYSTRALKPKPSRLSRLISWSGKPSITQRPALYEGISAATSGILGVETACNSRLFSEFLEDLVPDLRKRRMQWILRRIVPGLVACERNRSNRCAKGLVDAPMDSLRSACQRFSLIRDARSLGTGKPDNSGNRQQSSLLG